MTGITENDQRDPAAVLFGDLGPLAVRVGTAVDEAADSRHNRGVYGLISCGAGLNLPAVELEVMSRGLLVVKFQYQADPAAA